MSKVSGSYESVVRGVSEQVPQDRLSGQHWEQVNMVPDPVRGLSRRHGSVTVAEAAQPFTFANLLANTASHRAFTFSIDSVGYDLLYRTGARVTGTGSQGALFCFNRTTGQFMPVVVHSTAATDALVAGGVSAITQVGKFVLMGGNTYTTAYSQANQWDVDPNNAKWAIWIRGGGYSRTFTITLTRRSNGSKVSVSYKTKSSSYPNLLDTTDILTSDPDYQKKVNDRVYAYNSAVTAYIGEAAEDITPENIANQLSDELFIHGYGLATVKGSTILFSSGLWSEVAVDDGGDGSLAKAVGNTVESAEELCPVHYVNRVVRVRPSKENPDSAYYVKAYATDDTTTAPVAAEVTWKETAGVTFTPSRLFVLAAVKDGTLYVSDNVAWLEAQLGPAPNDVPVLRPNEVGDATSNPLPNFFGKRIDFLTVFQDRLVVGSGPVISMSKRGDYFNFFRTSTLTILDDDPVEVFSLGSEEDVIKHATPFNRDLILYGLRGQYAVTGRVPITPGGASIVATVSKYESAINAVPKVSGNLAFYAAKRGTEGARVTSLQQIQPAALSDNPDSQDVSPQLDAYLQGTAIELVTLTKPNTVVLRTDTTRNGLYLFNYLDKVAQGERVLAAWHRWAWHPLVGHLVGLSTSDEGDLYAYVLRQAADGAPWLACERFSLSGALSSRPYLDAQRPSTSPGSLLNADPEQLAKAHGDGPDVFEGATMAELLAMPSPPPLTGSALGVMFDAWVTPTNPFPRDSQNRAITFGRLTLGTLRVTVADTGGLKITTDRAGHVATVLDFNGYIVGSSILGNQPVVTKTVVAYIGAEVRECKYTISSKSWLPLNVTSIEWAGQIFNRQRRA